MTLDDARTIACGLLHNGINANKLSEKARAQLRAAIERLIALAPRSEP